MCRCMANFASLEMLITFDDASLGFDPIEFRAGMDRAYDYNGTKGLLTDVVPTKPGYKFDGWYTSPEFSANTKVGTHTFFTAPVTLYAKWVALPSPVWWYVFAGLGGLTVIGCLVWYLVFFKKLKMN